MNAVMLEQPENSLETRRRLAKKVKRREWVVESVTFQRHRARIRKYFRARHAQDNQVYQGIASVDDVFVFDRLGNRIIYPVTRIDQLPQFKKG